ncbi:MAG: hypothetical protein JXB07_21080 [Anaerolineae bacterium]|nr:hypothetical protein [Anaerolineae bacterium]
MVEFFSRALDNLRQGPLGPVVRWIEIHPRLTAWFVLALGMVTLLVIEARDVALLPGQWVALIVATILVAGICIWIVGWEDDDQSEEDTVVATESVAESPLTSSEESAPAPKKRTRKTKK